MGLDSIREDLKEILMYVSLISYFSIFLFKGVVIRVGTFFCEDVACRCELLIECRE